MGPLEIDYWGLLLFAHAAILAISSTTELPPKSHASDVSPGAIKTILLVLAAVFALGGGLQVGGLLAEYWIHVMWLGLTCIGGWAALIARSRRRRLHPRDRLLGVDALYFLACPPAFFSAVTLVGWLF